MNIVYRSLIIFLVLLVASSLMIEYFGYEFGDTNYFDKRGVFFLVFVTLFPRLTLLFSSVPFGGVLWWLGLIFCPRILVAVLATVNYFQTNPILVILSWLIALGGEGLEKYGLRGRRNFVFRYHYVSPDRGQAYRRPEQSINQGDTVEAEYRRKF